MLLLIPKASPSPRKARMRLKEAVERLRDAGVGDPEYDARALLCHLSGDRALLPLDIPREIEEQFSALIERRASREPLQYIIGTVGFYREEYRVDPCCLIPRSDTELLVDIAVKHLPSGALFYDLCTGSGCVGISTLANTRETRAIAVDISRDAVRIARENAERNGVTDRFEAVVLDLERDFPSGERPFAILSNPPYIERRVYEGLEQEIFCEPREAFVGGEDGLDFYKRLIPLSLCAIADGGFCAFEIGYDQAEAVKKIATASGASCEIYKDLGGNDRVAFMRK